MAKDRCEQRQGGAVLEYMGADSAPSMYSRPRFPSVHIVRSTKKIMKYFYDLFVAGVGRTGTLVALDSLMQQLQDENQVSIFNTVYDMRHQRNFLVQSLVCKTIGHICPLLL